MTTLASKNTTPSPPYFRPPGMNRMNARKLQKTPQSLSLRRFERERMNTIKEKGNSISYSYTSRDQIMEMMDQHLTRESFSYRDTSANIYHDRPYSMTDREGRTTVYTYGDADRYYKASYLSDNEYEEYTYDGAKRMTLARSSVTGDVDYTYTGASHNFTGLVNSMDSPQGLVDYGYDAGGRRSSMSATVGTGGSADTLDVTYTYNSKGLLNTLVFESSFIKGNPKTRTLSFSYDSSGRRTGISYPSTATASYVYNSSSGELVGIEHSYNSTAFEDMDYTYDTMGLVNSLSRAGVDPIIPGLMNAAYDSANRHTAFDGGALPEYDANGNMVQRGSVAYTYGQKNRLVRVTGTPEGTVDYSYDALDRRVSKVVNGTATQYLYDGLNIVAEEDASGDVTAFYVMGLGLDEPLARIETNGDIYYYHADILGSIVALTDEDGAVVTQYNYSPFGVTSAISESVVQPFRFTGREWDAETGMYYYRARYYAPDVKSFTSEDPIRFESGDTNWYRYVDNDPVNKTDPLGLFPNPWRNPSEYYPHPPSEDGAFCDVDCKAIYVAKLVKCTVSGGPDYNDSKSRHDQNTARQTYYTCMGRAKTAYEECK